jgi:uncharacterized protein (TIGR02266 family)
MLRNMPAIFREYMALERRRDAPEGISVAEYQRWMHLKRTLNRHFQPGVQDSHADRRESVRVPLRLHMGFQSYGEIRETLMTNVSRGGIFVATEVPLPMGSKLRVWIRIEESGQEIDLEGEVASHNSGPGLLSEELGMGIKFIRMSPDQEKAIDNLYERSLRRAIEGKPQSGD